MTLSLTPSDSLRSELYPLRVGLPNATENTASGGKTLRHEPCGVVSTVNGG